MPRLHTDTSCLGIYINKRTPEFAIRIDAGIYRIVHHDNELVTDLPRAVQISQIIIKKIPFHYNTGDLFVSSQQIWNYKRIA